MRKNPRLRAVETPLAAQNSPGSAISDYILVRGNKLLGTIRAVAFTDAAEAAAHHGWLEGASHAHPVLIVGPRTVTGTYLNYAHRVAHTAVPRSGAEAARAVAARVANPRKQNPSIREAQAAEQILGWDATCDIVGSGGLSGASGYDLSRLVCAAKKKDRKTFDKLVRVSARYNKKVNPLSAARAKLAAAKEAYGVLKKRHGPDLAMGWPEYKRTLTGMSPEGIRREARSNPASYAPGTRVQLRKDHWIGFGTRGGVVEGSTGSFSNYSHRTYVTFDDGAYVDVDTKALEPERKSNPPAWDAGDGLWTRNGWRITREDRHYLGKGVQFDLYFRAAYKGTFKTLAAAKAAVGK